MCRNMKTTSGTLRLSFALIGSLASFVLFSSLQAQSALAQGNGKGKGNSNQQHGKGATSGADHGGRPSGNQQIGPSQNSSGGSTLSPAQATQLASLLEEEKLAHDVYLALAKTSGLQIFTTIAKSESQHMRTIEQLVSHYSVAPSAKNLPAGTFSNPTFQSLYQTLVSSGSKSPLDAARVGAKVEELDIKDLQKLLSENPPQQIAQVLKHLQMASMNHLRAFTTVVKEMGGTYTPEHLNQQEFNEIVSSSNQQGMGMGQGVGGKSGTGNRGGEDLSNKHDLQIGPQSKKGMGQGKGKRGPGPS
jgi:hypothetical protein